MQYLSPFPGFRKTQRLHLREEQLRHALRHELASSKVAKAAEGVRQAKLHLIKALRFALLDHHPNDSHPEIELTKLDREADLWESCPIEVILDLYRQKEPDQTGRSNGGEPL